MIAPPDSDTDEPRPDSSVDFNDQNNDINDVDIPEFDIQLNPPLVPPQGKIFGK